MSLRLPSKCSFTFCKLRFFRLRKPKTTSFYSLSSVLGLTISLFSQPFLYSEPGSKCKALARTHISADYSRAIDIILFAQNKKKRNHKGFSKYSEPGSNRYGHFCPQDFKSGVSTYSTIRAVLKDGANVQFLFYSAKIFRYYLRSATHPKLRMKFSFKTQQKVSTSHYISTP